jgi:hypothetical protein
MNLAKTTGLFLDLTERDRLVLHWRETDPPLPYRHIAQRIGVGTHRARQIYLEAKVKIERLKDPHWSKFRGLTGKEYGILFYNNISSPEEALKAFEDGRLKPMKHGRWSTDGVRGLGKKTFVRLAQWAGYQLPAPPVRKKKICPHCGGQL